MKIKTWAEVACVLLWLSILLIVSKIIASFLKAECVFSMIDAWLWLESRTIRIQLTLALFRAKQKKKQFTRRVDECFRFFFMRFIVRFFFTIAAKINLHHFICFEIFLESLLNNCVIFEFDMIIDCQTKFFERKIHRIDERRSQIHNDDEEISWERKKNEKWKFKLCEIINFFLT
jgi:hypothetical protein